MLQPNFSDLKALYINCTLKRGNEPSHTRGLIDVSANIMKKHNVDCEVIRLINLDVPPGVYPDMTEHGYDADPFVQLKEKILNADILVIGSPIWLGEKSSVCTLLMERLYSLSGQTNEKGQYKYYGKVGGCIITGNEDGVKHCAMSILYGLQHVGYTIPPQADTGWLGEIGPGPSYLDDGSNAADSDFTNRNTTFMTYNLLHMAKMMKSNNGIDSYGNSSEAWADGERWEFEKPKS